MDLEEVEFLDPLDGSLLNISVEEEVGAQRFSCGICEASFTTKSNLGRHAKTHDDRYTHECKKCTQFFESQAALADHDERKHSDSSRNQLCSFCGKAFWKKSHLQQHQARFHNTGSLERKYCCPIDECDKSFLQKDKLYDHMNFHSVSKPFSCEKCAKAFHSKYYRNKHAKICSGETKAECEVCGLVFSDLSSLKRHTDAQHNHKTFTCHCGKTFLYKSSLTKHQKNKH